MMIKPMIEVDVGQGCPPFLSLRTSRLIVLRRFILDTQQFLRRVWLAYGKTNPGACTCL
jgi:hypothetical protein